MKWRQRLDSKPSFRSGGCYCPLDPPDHEFRPLHEAFLRQAAVTPDAVAVEFQGQGLSYYDLAERSGRFAAHLHGLGAGADTVVGVALERSAELIVAILGILRAGSAWMPLDPSYPSPRLAYMLEDSGVNLLVTDSNGAAGLPDTGVRRVDPRAASRHPASEPPTTAVSWDNLAYVIYTSGSTGRPKGVALNHHGLINLAEAQVRAFGVGPGKRVLQFAPTSFDASVSEIAMALHGGATLVLAPRATMVPGPELADLLRAARITHVTLPPSVLATLPDTNLPDLETLVCAGETLPGPLAQQWLVGRRLFNAYGPTETTVCATLAEVHAGSGTPSIGRAIDGVRTVVLDEHLRPVPVGEPGELAIGGKGVARGYLGEPGLTAQRFVPDWLGDPGGRLYLTGDRVRLRPDGDLEFLGRLDDQVKLRGFRIEPGEVAATLREHRSVRDAVVVVRHDGGDDRLVAYAAGADLDPLELRVFLADRLPAHSVPSAVVVMAALPLSPSGKIDRAALPLPDRASASLPVVAVAPRTPTEQVLAALVRELLGVQEVGIHDNFFDLGGHFLLAGMLAARVRAELGRELPLGHIFRAPTVAAMAELLASVPPSDGVPPVVPVARDGRMPLSFPQERIWFLEQLAPGNLAYNVQATVRMRGPLDPATVQAALTEIVRRHEVYRTRFWAVDGIPAQQVLPPMPIHLPLVDVSDLPLPERDDRAEDVVRQAMRDPFDLARPPLARWLLIRHAEHDHTLVHVEHHFVHDGWSFAVFLRELQVIYGAFAERQPSPLPELPVQFADFAAWQRRWLSGDVLDRYLEFWTTELAGSPRTLDLPTDRPRPAMQSFEGAALRINLSPQLCRKLRQFSRERGVTLYATMLGGFAVLLHRYTGQTDLVVGSGVANRRLAEIEQLIGMVVNTLPLRLDASARPGFDELLGRVHETTTRAYDWQDVPLDRLVTALGLARDNSRNPLFQVMFSFHDSPVPEVDFAGATGTVLERHNGSAKADLNIVVIPRAEQRVGRTPRDDAAPITLIWEYATALFDETTMHQMVGHYEHLLEAAITYPTVDIGRLPMLGADEQQRLLVEFNDTAHPIPASGLLALFEAQVRATPDAVAVVFEGETVSYRELNTRANRLAHALAARGVGAESGVAVLLERSVDLVVSILGVVKAGGVYVPLDARYPPSRLGLVMEETGASVLLTDTAMGTRTFPSRVEVVVVDADPFLAAVAQEDTGDPGVACHPEQLAYVMYTSGSTGQPKGIAVTHGDVVALALDPRWAGGAQQRVLLHSASAFDASTYELWVPLLGGGQVVVAPPGDLDTAALQRVITQGEVTSVFVTTALFNLMAELCPGCFAGVRQVWTGGEMVFPPAIQCVLDACPETAVVHVYGPTETTTFATCHAMRPPCHVGSTVPIGRPMANLAAYVADAALQPVAPGVTGELYIGGAGLARGYLGLPGLTAERFVADPFGPPGTRMYRTGDLVRWNGEGDLEFVGR
ncbi:MAG TPA: amino acid adenylation domain-containing protein, partial [Acidimicrobiales bacterium]